MRIIDVRDTIPTCNYSDKHITPLGICYHITADINKGQALRWFQNSNAGVSAHYIVEPDGDIHLCVSPNVKAYHCGTINESSAQIIKDRYSENPNNYLIGIEVVANGNDITNNQFKSLKELTLELSKTYRFALNRYHLIMHREIDLIRRPFDPIVSYHVNEIIRGIESDQKIYSLNHKANILSTEKEQLIEKLEELQYRLDKIEREAEKRGKIVNKVRDYNKTLLNHIKDILKKKGD